MGAILLNSMILAIGLAAPDPVAELEEMQQKLQRAVVARDREGWSALVAPEWRVTHVDGKVLTKAEVLEMIFGPPQSPVAGGSVDEVEVRLFGANAAVVIGKTTAITRDGSRVVLRFTDFVLKRNGRWQVVGSQATPLKE